MISQKTFGWAVMATVLGCTLGLAIAGLAIAREDEYGNESRQQTKDQQADDRQTATQQIETKPVELQGQGRQASKKFDLEPGLCILEVDHAGDSNFIVRLLDANGNEIDTLVNQIGPFEGEIGFAVERPGQCLLDVEADGAWSAKLTQPRPESGQSLPATLEGKGHKTTAFLELDEGLAVFKMNHNGEGRFKARLANRDGRTVAHLVNTLGQFEGSKPVSIDEPGLYFLNISADGDWTIDVE